MVLAGLLGRAEDTLWGEEAEDTLWGEEAEETVWGEEAEETVWGEGTVCSDPLLLYSSFRIIILSSAVILGDSSGCIIHKYIKTDIYILDTHSVPLLCVGL